MLAYILKYRSHTGYCVFQLDESEVDLLGVDDSRGCSIAGIESREEQLSELRQMIGGQAALVADFTADTETFDNAPYAEVPGLVKARLQDAGSFLSKQSA